MFGLRMLNETWQRWDMLGAALIRLFRVPSEGAETAFLPVSSLAMFVGRLLVQSGQHELRKALLGVLVLQWTARPRRFP